MDAKKLGSPTVQQRLAKLEKQNRRLKVAGAMPSVLVGSAVIAALLALALAGCRSVPKKQAGRPEQELDALRAQYEDFLCSLRPDRFKQGYPALMQKLKSRDRDERITALRTIGQSGELDAIPLIVPIVLNEKDLSVRIWAGCALKQIVTSHELKRRDHTHPESVVILPRSPGDIDLRPLAWVLREMLAKPDDGNTAANAATMIGYLGLKEFEPDLRRLLDSRHPAVTTSAVHALRMMDLEVEKEPHPLEEPKL